MTSIYISKDKEELPERHKFDAYTTERTLIKAAIERYGPLRAHYVLDIGCGDGRWGEVVDSLCGPSHLDGVDIDHYERNELFMGWYVGQDFLTWNNPHKYDLIVSNPPYNIAEEIIRRAWDMLQGGGRMIMLLRSDFMASIGRYEGLWSEIYPHTVAMCSRRPSFYGGKTNGDEFAIYVWEKRPGSYMPVGKPRSWRMELLYHERDKTNK